MNPGATDTPVLAVFGGSGQTGRILLQQAAARGVQVRALVRKAASFTFSAATVEIIEGSLLNQSDVAATLAGSTAVICVFGPRPPYTDIFCRQATQTIVEQMHPAGVRRLVCQTGGMIGDYPANRSLAFRLMVALFNSRLPALAQDRAAQEEVIINSGLDWTLIKPPRLTNAPARGRWHIGTELKLGLLSRISRADLAAALLDVAIDTKFMHQAIFIRN